MFFQNTGFDCKHMYGGFKPSVTPVPAVANPFSGLPGPTGTDIQADTHS